MMLDRRIPAGNNRHHHDYQHDQHPTLTPPPPPVPIYRCESNGGFVFGANAVLTGEGVLEFSGGTGHEVLKDTNETVPPLVKVSGRAVVTFAGVNLSFGRGLTVVVSTPLSWEGWTGGCTRLTARPRIKKCCCMIPIR